MDGNGFTGFNPELAKANIEQFWRKNFEVGCAIDNMYTNLFSETYGLYLVWCSPKAVEFSNKYGQLIEDFMSSFDTEFINLEINARKAYNIMARQNGFPPFEDIGSPANRWVGIRAENLPLVYKHPYNGAVGINVKLAKMVLESYRMDFEKIIVKFDEIPSTIALYDDENSQQNTFSVNVNKYKERFVSLSKEIEKGIIDAIETEIDNNLLAKQQSVDVLNNA